MDGLSLSVLPSVPRKRDPPTHHSESSTGSAAPQSASYPFTSIYWPPGCFCCCLLLLAAAPYPSTFWKKNRRRQPQSSFVRPSIRPAAIRPQIEYSRVPTSRPDLTKNVRWSLLTFALRLWLLSRPWVSRDKSTASPTTCLP